jgi:predicted membrane-bound mannosyltransferase
MVRINAQFQWDERNPYVYVHTSSNLLKLVRRVADIADVSKEGRGLFIAVVTSPENAWPLPWYLRRYPSVGYWTDPSQLPAQPAEPALVIATPDFDEALDRRLGDGYLTEYYGLRPRQDVLLSLHIRRDLWDRFMQTRTTKPPR